MSIKQLSVTTLAILCVGCATTDQFQPTVNSWQGASVQSLIGSWGYPITIRKLPHHQSAYDYKLRFILITPQNSSGGNDEADVATGPIPEAVPVGSLIPAKPRGKPKPYVQQPTGTLNVYFTKSLLGISQLTDANGNPIPMTCKVTFIANANNHIVKITHQGNACKAGSMFYNAMANPQA